MLAIAKRVLVMLNRLQVMHRSGMGLLLGAHCNVLGLRECKAALHRLQAFAIRVPIPDILNLVLGATPGYADTISTALRQKCSRTM